MIEVGWREWGGLPYLGIPAIKMKVDTGARTSTLHAFKVERLRHRGRDRVRFYIHPLQLNTRLQLECLADVRDERYVTDSGGHREKRLVIATPLRLGGDEWEIEITLTRRDSMRFRMLLGRGAIRNRAIVNPSRSFLLGKSLAKTYRRVRHDGPRPRE
jgi:hypothetical protein